MECPSPRTCSAIGLLAVIGAQILLMAGYVIPASEVMREEASKLNAKGDIHTVIQSPFWGPLKVIIPNNCTLIQQYNLVVHKVLDQDNVAEPRSCHVNAGATLSAAAGLAQHAAGNAHAVVTSLRSGANRGADGLVVSPEANAEAAPALETLEAPAEAAAAEAGTAVWEPQEQVWEYPSDDHVRLRKLDDAEPTNTTEAPEMHIAEKAARATLSHLHSKTHDFIRGALEAERRRRSFTLELCGKNVTFTRPDLLTRYLSLILLDRQMSDKSQPSVAEMLAKRKRTFDALVVGIALTMAIKYIPKFVFIFQYIFGDRTTRKRGARSRFDKALEGVILHSISSIFLFTLQMSLCTVFLVFWSGGHFVMAHIPSASYVIFFVSLVGITVANELDKIFGWSLRFCTAQLTFAFWSAWSAWMLAITVPVIGTCIYSIQYLKTVFLCGWLHSEDVILSKRFEEAADHACGSCMWFMILMVIEQVVHIALEMHEANQKVVKVSVHAFPRTKHYLGVPSS